MLVSPKFAELIRNGQRVFQRKGYVSTLVLPENIEELTTTTANIEETSVVLSEGESNYIMVDRFGIITTEEDIEANIFFIDGGMVVDLLQGVVVIEGENGTYNFIDHDGETGELNSEYDYSVVWFEYQNVYENAHKVLQYKYKVTPEKAEHFLNNIVILSMFGIQRDLSFVQDGQLRKRKIKGHEVIRMQFIEEYEDLGLGLVQIVESAEDQELRQMMDSEEEEYIDFEDDEDLVKGMDEEDINGEDLEINEEMNRILN